MPSVRSFSFVSVLFDVIFMVPLRPVKKRYDPDIRIYSNRYHLRSQGFFSLTAGLAGGCRYHWAWIFFEKAPYIEFFFLTCERRLYNLDTLISPALFIRVHRNNFELNFVARGLHQNLVWRV
jgi:hypothetical protein